ncbi:hypothetical protein CLSAP_03750 [Clostridium saccharoperbutylacetonicum]|nr:hypothetical protein CLSAP_03750 [Clostridium saccharoperbutylacetonicum]NSB34510.1 hypothetical protein [Clostridium saccharoperbutylacetonicum]
MSKNSDELLLEIENMLPSYIKEYSKRIFNKNVEDISI